MARCELHSYNAAMIVNWQGALDYLYSLANWETRPPGTELTFELDRVRHVLEELGGPQMRWPAVHVVGTNGKGSTAAMIATALQAAGHRTGLFTSPHLHTVRERVAVDGAPIAEREVVGWLNEHRTLLDAHAGLTTFEALTAMAFSHFAERNVDVAVVEAGLGGRLDTTNVVEPIVTVLTPVGLDHTSVLGDTPVAIARDKIGVFRPGVPVVVGRQTPEVSVVVREQADRLGSPVLELGREVRASRVDSGGDLVVDVDATVSGASGGQPRAGRSARYQVEVGLDGPHQDDNAATAVAALSVLERSGLAVPDDAVRRGVREVVWPGRFEVLSESPVLIVDGAHNPPAAAALRRALDERYPGRAVHVVVGLSRDKDAEGVLAPLVEAARSVTATRSEHPRALEAEAVSRVARRMGGIEHHVEATPAAALESALRRAGPDDVVLGTGSIFLVADLREAWAERGGMPMPPRDPPPEPTARHE